jgi:hypothetical protein
VKWRLEDQVDHHRGGHKWISKRTDFFDDNHKELHVIESKRNAITKGLVYELLNAQDTVLCSYFAQISGERSDCQNQGGTAAWYSKDDERTLPHLHFARFWLRLKISKKSPKSKNKSYHSHRIFERFPIVQISYRFRKGIFVNNLLFPFSFFYLFRLLTLLTLLLRFFFLNLFVLARL